MKSIIVKIGATLLAIMVFAGCAAPGERHRITMDDNGMVITVREGDVVELELPDDPLSGNSWQWARPVNRAVLHPTWERYLQHRDASGQPSGGGESIFYFEATAPGDSRLHLKSRRMWDGNALPVDVFDVLVEVVPRPEE